MAEPTQVSVVSWDLPVLGFLLLASLRGFWRGVFREIGSLVGCLSGIILGWWGAVPLAEGMRSGAPGAASQLDAALVFLGTFVGLWMVGGLVGWAVEKLVRNPVAVWVSGAAGMVVGAIKGGVIAGACLVFAQVFVPQAAAQIEHATVARWLSQATSTATMWLVRYPQEP
ncbi:MAG: CvpA family protein [Candidatus Binatia bacterium]|nr:CvpA family protein [Candidatus Binatia bacterium]